MIIGAEKNRYCGAGDPHVALLLGMTAVVADMYNNKEYPNQEVA